MRRLLDAIVSQCGFRPDRLTVPWVVGGALSFALSEAVRSRNDLVLAAIYFAVTSAFYYLGNAWWLSVASAGARRLSGDAAEREWTAYQAWVGLMFFTQGLGISAMASVTFAGSTLPLPAELAAFAGAVLVAVGIVVKTWATMVVGVDCYYYRDLFFRRRVWGFCRVGPYALLENPMYGAGNLHLYGVALLTRSIPALVAAVFCHAAIYAFHHGVERPFVRESLGAE